MKVRKPQIDYSNVPLYWSHNHEFAQRWNAGSLVPAYIEPFLVKVLNQAKPALIAAGREDLMGDVDIFIKQEMEHCKNHVKFNRNFWTYGYDALKPMEAKFAADYDNFLKNCSPRFCMAYCEGFEAMSAISVTAVFEEFDEFFEGANQEVVDLWKWHLAEEYEHRTVMHDVFHALYAKNPISGYFWRIYGLVYAMVHMGGFSNRAAKLLIAQDREGMTREQLAKSIDNEKRVARALRGPLWRHALEIFSPFYKPARRKPPRGADAYLGAGYPPAPASMNGAVPQSA